MAASEGSLQIVMFTHAQFQQLQRAVRAQQAGFAGTKSSASHPACWSTLCAHLQKSPQRRHSCSPAHPFFEVLVHLACSQQSITAVGCRDGGGRSKSQQLLYRAHQKQTQADCRPGQFWHAACRPYLYQEVISTWNCSPAESQHTPASQRSSLTICHSQLTSSQHLQPRCTAYPQCTQKLNHAHCVPMCHPSNSPALSIVQRLATLGSGGQVLAGVHAGGGWVLAVGLLKLAASWLQHLLHSQGRQQHSRD